MFRRMTSVTMLLMLALLSAVGNAQQSGSQSGQQGSSQSGQQGSSQSGQSTDRTRSGSRDSNQTQSDRNNSTQQDNNRAQSGNNNTSRQDGKISSSDREFAMKAAEGGRLEVMHAQMALQKSSNDEVKRYAQRMIDDHTKANQELMSVASGKGIMLPSDTQGQMQGANSEMRSGSSTSGGTTGTASSGSTSSGSTGTSSASSGSGRTGTSASGTTNPSSATGATNPNTESSGDMRKTDSGMKMSKEHQAAMDRLGKLSGAEFDREYLKMDLNDHKKTIELFEKQARGGRDAELKAFAEKTLPTLREHHQMARDIAGKVGGTGSGANR